ncbi:MAG: LysR substrate-binding domain-containing protein [Myxococcota bacterium]|nr:LysR substrate-binding domain-containing protein [Myxococcota bacterium]
MVTAPNDLTLRQLQYVVAVADTLGFHRAAVRCHVSQPTLSAQVQQVEAVLRVQIFERDRRRVLLTSVGHDIVARARQVLIEVDDLIAAATRVREPFAGTLRVAVIPTIAPYLLPEVMPAIHAKYPKLSLMFREEKTSDIVRDLADGEVDAGLLAVVPEISEFVFAEIANDAFVVALPKGHALARRKRLTLSDLEGVPVLLLDEDHCFRDQALALCSQANASPTSFRATSLTTLAQMVSSGAGITLLPRLAVPVENRRAQLEIRPFVKPEPYRTIALAWRRGSPYASAFTELTLTIRAASTW